MKRKEKRLPDILTTEEITRLLDQPPINTALGIRDRAIFEVMYASGLRVSEVIGLKISCIHPEMEVIKVFGKGSKDRYVPISHSALDWINRYKQVRMEMPNSPKDILFLNWRGQQLTRQALWKKIRQYAEEAEITKPTHPHTMRHSFATDLVKGGADLEAIRMMMGHKSISTTQIYLSLDTDYLKKIYKNAHSKV